MMMSKGRFINPISIQKKHQKIPDNSSAVGFDFIVTNRNITYAETQTYTNPLNGLNPFMFVLEVTCLALDLRQIEIVNALLF